MILFRKTTGWRMETGNSMHTVRYQVHDSADTIYTQRAITRAIILRKTFGLVEGDGQHRIRTNHELESIVHVKKIITFIKNRKMRRLDHLCRLEAGRNASRIME